MGNYYSITDYMGKYFSITDCRGTYYSIATFFHYIYIYIISDVVLFVYICLE